MTAQICGNCKHRGDGVPGCPFGGFPNAHERCIHPGKFQVKVLPPSYELETPTEWHLTGYPPKVPPKRKVAKKAPKKASLPRDSKTGKFLPRKGK